MQQPRHDGGPPEHGGLAGIRVLDLGRVHSGPFCGRVLADLGAEVIKVEPPGGDDSRHFGPFHEGVSGDYRLLNRNKRGITLDLKSEEDKRVLHQLVLRSDVLLENFRPGVLARLFASPAELLEINPRLVVVSISGYGHTGPLTQSPAYDLIVQAMSGLVSITGPDGGPGVRVGVSVGDIVPGLYGVIGALAALHDRDRTGRGQHVDVAMFDGLVSILENPAMNHLITGADVGPTGRHHASSAPFGVFDTATGPIGIAAANDAVFGRLVGALGLRDLLADPRFASDELRGTHREVLEQELGRVLGTMVAADALELLGAAGVPCSPVQTVAEALAHPQAEARGLVPTEADGFRTLGAGVRVRGSVTVPRTAPRLGEHNDDLAALLAEPLRTTADHLPPHPPRSTPS